MIVQLFILYNWNYAVSITNLDKSEKYEGCKIRRLKNYQRYDIVQSKKTPILEKITKGLLYDC